MSQTIYIVTAGASSDYHIEAVFMDPAEAESFVSEYNKAIDGLDSSFAGIEEYTAGGKRGWLCQTVYHCATWDNGDLTPSGEWAGLEVVPLRYFKVKKHHHGDRWRFCASSSVSADHALKLCAEARQKWLREKAEK